MHPLLSHYMAIEKSLELHRRAEASRRSPRAPRRRHPSVRILLAVGSALTAAGDAITRAGQPGDACSDRPRTA